MSRASVAWPSLASSRPQGIPRLDELPRRDSAECIGGILAGFWHVLERASKGRVSLYRSELDA